jgi:hypothetical protein
MLTIRQLTKLIILSAILSSLFAYSTLTAAFDSKNQDNLTDSSGMLLAANNKNKGHTAQPQIKSAPPRAAYRPANIRNTRTPRIYQPRANIKYHNPSAATYRQVKTKKHYQTTTTIPNKTKSKNKITTVNNPNVLNKTKVINKNNVNTPSLIKPILPVGTAVTGAGIVNSAGNINPPHVVTNTQPSHLLNKFTKKNIQKSKTLNQQFLNNPNNAKWVKNINGYQKNYRLYHHNTNIQAFKVYNTFWHNHHYHDWYRHWYKWGFYGGFWYPVRPYFDIDDYFDYPMVQWFYTDDPITTDYYNDYYPAESVPPNSCLTSFPYTNIYFPTDTLRDLLIEVSGFSQNLLCDFRVSIINFTSQMQQTVSNTYSINFSFQQNNIVVNYYQNLQNKAIVIAGFVSQNKINLAFEGFLDLEQPNQTIAFAPKGQNPTDDELQVLEQLNDRIKSLGGDPFTAQQEPVQGQTQQTSGDITQENSSSPGP